MELKEFFPMWGELTEDDRRVLADNCAARHFEKGATIHNGSADCAGLILVRGGQLRAFSLSEEGREVTLYRLFDRDVCLFSASCMMRSIQFDVTIRAEKDTDAFVITPDAYKQVMDRSAPLANYTGEIMASRFSDVMWLMEQIMWKSFDKRLARFLLDEAALEETDTLSLTHEVIAAHLGSAREVVTRMLRYFQSEGMVRLSRGSIAITDRGKLEALDA